MPDSPLVSVIVPTLNRPRLVERAVESADAQRYPNLEIVVVDDSTYAEQRPPSFEQTNADLRYIYSKDPKGLATARNRGIKAASGDFIAFLDDDDMWEPDKTTKQIKNLQETDAGLCTSWRYMVGEDETPITIAKDDVDGDVVRKLLCRNVVGPPSGVIVSRQVIHDVGKFDEAFDLWEDREWYIRVAQEYDVVCVREPLVRYATETKDKMSGNLEKVRDETYDQFLHKHSALVETYGANLVEGWRYRKLGKMAYDSGSRLTAAYFAIRAIAAYYSEWPFYRLLIRVMVGKYLYDRLDTLKSRIGSLSSNRAHSLE